MAYQQFSAPYQGYTNYPQSQQMQNPQSGSQTPQTPPGKYSMTIWDAGGWGGLSAPLGGSGGSNGSGTYTGKAGTTSSSGWTAPTVYGGIDWANLENSNAYAKWAARNAANQSAEDQRRYLYDLGVRDPYIQSSFSGLSQLGGLADGTVDVSQTPGYQFRLQQGQKALEAQQAARGNYFSPRALQEMAAYSQGLASQEYQNEWNRAAQQAYTGSPYGWSPVGTGGAVDANGPNLMNLRDFQAAYGDMFPKDSGGGAGGGSTGKIGGRRGGGGGGGGDTAPGPGQGSWWYWDPKLGVQQAQGDLPTSWGSPDMWGNVPFKSQAEAEAWGQAHPKGSSTPTGGTTGNKPSIKSVSPQDKAALDRLVNGYKTATADVNRLKDLVSKYPGSSSYRDQLKVAQSNLNKIAKALAQINATYGS